MTISIEGADDTSTGSEIDQQLVLRKPKTEIIMPESTRTLAYSQSFAAKHSVLLVPITI